MNCAPNAIRCGSLCRLAPGLLCPSPNCRPHLGLEFGSRAYRALRPPAAGAVHVSFCVFRELIGGSGRGVDAVAFGGAVISSECSLVFAAHRESPRSRFEIRCYTRSIGGGGSSMCARNYLASPARQRPSLTVWGSVDATPPRASTRAVEFRLSWLLGWRV